MSEIRSLSSKVIELRNYCDDIENEKRELLQNKSECENLIAVLEEKCRNKDRELNEIRDSCSELEILRIEYEKMKNELVRYAWLESLKLFIFDLIWRSSYFRITTALKNAQEINTTIDLLEKENEKLLKENTEFQTKVRL